MEPFTYLGIIYLSFFFVRVLMKRWTKIDEKILRSPTGHRINRDGRIVDKNGKIKSQDN